MMIDELCKYQPRNLLPFPRLCYCFQPSHIACKLRIIGIELSEEEAAPTFLSDEDKGPRGTRNSNALITHHTVQITVPQESKS